METDAAATQQRYDAKAVAKQQRFDAEEEITLSLVKQSHATAERE